jgi:hypothetical protein
MNKAELKPCPWKEIEPVMRTCKDCTFWLGKARHPAPDARLVEALKAIVDCWDGPDYKHVMGPNIDRAKAALKAAGVKSP